MTQLMKSLKEVKRLLEEWSASSLSNCSLWTGSGIDLFCVNRNHCKVGEVPWFLNAERDHVPHVDMRRDATFNAHSDGISR